MKLGALLLLVMSARMDSAVPVAWWSFDAENGNEKIGGKSVQIIGHHGFEKGVRGRALRSDEFETVMEHVLESPGMLDRGFSVEAWIAPRAFPWNECPLIERGNGAVGWHFGIDYQGRLCLRASAGGKWMGCESRSALPGLDESLRFAGEPGRGNPIASFGDARPDPSVPLLVWTHVVGTVDPGGRMNIYINGERAGGVNGGAAPDACAAPLRIARTSVPVMPLFLARPAANSARDCSFDGLMDEIKFYDHALSGEDVRVAFNEVQPADKRPLKFRRMPTAQDRPGAFGAFHTRFPYDEDWDRTRRFGDMQDLFVRFDTSPCTFVCWNGTIYPIFYADGGNVGQQFEAFEAWDKDGCHEAMMDRRNQYSSWRIVENHPARVVLHWRHALVSQNGKMIHVDPHTGWGDMVDDYYTIYPDAVCARRTVLWTSNPLGSFSYAQDNSVMQPGLMPWDIYENEPMSVADIRGRETVMTMGKGHRGPKDPDFRGPAVIQLHRFKTTWKPFMISPPNESFGGVWTNDEPWPWFLPCWHHWPTAQLIDSDGSTTFVENGRPKSSCLTNGWGYQKPTPNAVEITDRSLTRYSLIGMTNRPAGELAPLARSWRHAPKTSIVSGGKNASFDLGKKAFRMQRVASRDIDPVSLRVEASDDSPLQNPAFMVADWPSSSVRVEVNGIAMPAGRSCRSGLVSGSQGNDLVVWLELAVARPVVITFHPVIDEPAENQ